MRKAALGIVALLGLGMAALAVDHIQLNKVADAMVRSDLTWVLLALALMASSLFVRAWSWFFISKSAMPHSGLKRRDFASATMIGVLMSATLPARLGEPARAISLARHRPPGRPCPWSSGRSSPRRWSTSWRSSCSVSWS